MTQEADTVVETPAEQPQEQAKPESNSLLNNDVELSEGEYLLYDGVKGIGEKPEWYNDKKYKTVAEQAKAQRELEKKLGAFTGAPEDGYKLDDEFGHLTQDPLYQEFSEFAKESGMSQEHHDKLVATFLAGQQVSSEDYRNEQLSKLGDNAQQRITNVDNFLRGNLKPEQYDKYSEAVNSAESVELIEALIKATRPTKVPAEGGDNPMGVTEQQLKEMYLAEDKYGNRKMEDPAYAAEYRKKAEYFYGKQ